MSVALAALALIWLVADGRLPRNVVVKVLTLVTVLSFCVMCTLALAVHHVRDGAHVEFVLVRYAPLSVTVTGTRTAHDQLINGIIILLVDVRAIIEQVIAKCVKLGEVYPQVSDLQ